MLLTLEVFKYLSSKMDSNWKEESLSCSDFSTASRQKDKCEPLCGISCELFRNKDFRGPTSFTINITAPWALAFDLPGIEVSGNYTHCLKVAQWQEKDSNFIPRKVNDQNKLLGWQCEKLKKPRDFLLLKPRLKLVKCLLHLVNNRSFWGFCQKYQSTFLLGWNTFSILSLSKHGSFPMPSM